jgi:anti-anti-sigma factor
MASAYHSKAINSTLVDDVTVCTFARNIIANDQHAQMIEDELVRLVDVERRKKIVLDFENAEFMSGSLPPILSSLHQKLLAGNGNLTLVNVTTAILNILKITDLDRILNISTSLNGTQNSGTPIEGVLTADDIYDLEQCGLTLEDAIRAIESSQG